MLRAVVNPKGQVTIPFELPKRLEIKPSTRVNRSEEPGRFVMAPMTLRRRNEIRRCLTPKPGPPSAFDELFAENRARATPGEVVGFNRPSTPPPPPHPVARSIACL